MSRIELLTHRCVDEKTGNKNREPVHAHHIEFKSECDECGELLAPLHEVVAHIYYELTGDPS